MADQSKPGLPEPIAYLVAGFVLAAIVAGSLGVLFGVNHAASPAATVHPFASVPPMAKQKSAKAASAGPWLGETVLFHDPLDGHVWPATVVHVDMPGDAESALDLCVFDHNGARGVRNVPHNPGDFGHWRELPAR